MYSFLKITMQVARLPSTPSTRNSLEWRYWYGNMDHILIYWKNIIPLKTFSLGTPTYPYITVRGMRVEYSRCCSPSLARINWLAEISWIERCYVVKRRKCCKLTLRYIFRHFWQVRFTDQGQRLLYWTHYFYLLCIVVQQEMSAVGVRNEGEDVIEFVWVIERLDLLDDQILVEVGGHFCDGGWSINDPFFLSTRRLLLWSGSGGDYGWPMMIHLFTLRNFSITLGRLFFIISENDKSCLIKPPLIMTSHFRHMQAPLCPRQG